MLQKIVKCPYVVALHHYTAVRLDSACIGLTLKYYGALQTFLFSCSQSGQRAQRLIVCAGSGEEAKKSLHPAVPECARMSWESSTIREPNSASISDDGIDIEPLKWIQVCSCSSGFSAHTVHKMCVAALF